MYKQRKKGREGRLTADRIALLDGVDFDWGCDRSFILPVGGGTAGFRDDENINSYDRLSSVAAVEGGRVKSQQVHSGSKFDVNIPVHYNDLYPSSAIDEVSCGRECIEDGKEANDPPADKSKESNSDETGADTLTEQNKLHHQFIVALERYGPMSGSEEGTLAWHAMAASLNWSVNDVKVYAYSYFKALTVRKDQCDGAKSCAQEKKTASQVEASHASSWASDELVLLDSLVLEHCNSINGAGQINGNNSFINSALIWQKIAANLPGRTPQDCHRTWISRN